MFEDVPLIFEKPVGNETTIDDVLILVFTGRLLGIYFDFSLLLLL